MNSSKSTTSYIHILNLLLYVMYRVLPSQLFMSTMDLSFGFHHRCYLLILTINPSFDSQAQNNLLETLLGDIGITSSACFISSCLANPYARIRWSPETP